MSDKTNGKLEGEHYAWPTQTDRQGHPIYDNQNNCMVGNRGPTRYRVGPNYLQLLINWPRTKVATNQRDGQMTCHVDSVDSGANPHVNYEPTSRRGPREAQLAGKPHTHPG